MRPAPRGGRQGGEPAKQAGGRGEAGGHGVQGSGHGEEGGQPERWTASVADKRPARWAISEAGRQQQSREYRVYSIAEV